MGIEIPTDFRAIVATAPSRIDNTTVPKMLEGVEKLGLHELDGHRIFHMHQVHEMDTSAVAALLDMLTRAKKHGREFVICDPPPVVRSYLDIYGENTDLEGRILSSADDGTYHSDVIPFVPPYVPDGDGRIDIYADGKVTSYEFAPGGLTKVKPVNLDSHPPKAPTRAHRMAVAGEGGEYAEVKSRGYIHVRRHRCGCDVTHQTFKQLHALHAWFRHKGFDFQSVELWASDVPAGIVTEKLTFRDRMHYGQFETLLKVDSSWQEIGAPVEHSESEFYYIY